jgi:hypothetical protein
MTQTLGNAPPCNSFNANVGGGVTALDAQTQHRVSVVAVHPTEVFSKTFEQKLTLTEQAVGGDCRGGCASSM